MPVEELVLCQPNLGHSAEGNDALKAVAPAEQLGGFGRLTHRVSTLVLECQEVLAIRVHALTLRSGRSTQSFPDRRGSR